MIFLKRLDLNEVLILIKFLIHNPETLESNVPGIYIAGVIICRYAIQANCLLKTQEFTAGIIIEDILKKN